MLNINKDSYTESLKVDITRALAIEGWMSEQELVWLAAQAQRHDVIVEIGSHLGRSTRALADHTLGIVFAFDDFNGPRDVYLEKKEREQIWKRFCSNMQDRTNVVMIRGKYEYTYTTFSTPHLQACIPDMVFIDGSHEYEDVKRDILFWKDKLVPGGLLCGHDATFEDVGQAILDTIKDATVAPYTTIWYKEV
jgi:predicted O-methyltransferase YrrM